MKNIIKIKPLSINQAFKGRRFKTQKYDTFIFQTIALLPSNLKFRNRNIRLDIEFGFSSKLSDIDNCCKPFIDCLVKKYGIDDRYIDELHVTRKIVKKGFEYISFTLI